MNQYTNNSVTHKNGNMLLRERDWRWNCDQEYTIIKEVGNDNKNENENEQSESSFLVQFFFIDTSPFVKKYQKRVNECLNRPISAEEGNNRNDNKDTDDNDLYYYFSPWKDDIKFFDISYYHSQMTLVMLSIMV